MDSELFTSVLALLTAAWTAWQEYRHRKAPKTSTGKLLKVEPKVKP